MAQTAIEFSKEYFNNSNEIARKAFEEVWDGSQKMVDYCMKSATHYKLNDGRIFSIDKPSIETKFCFGYHTDYTGHECSDAEALRAKCAKSVDYFMGENLRSLNRVISELSKNDEPLFFTNHYSRGGENVLVSTISDEYLRRFPFDKKLIIGEVSAEDKALIIEAYKNERVKFTKRLETYLKKYGLSKIETWTYWLDE